MAKISKMRVLSEGFDVPNAPNAAEGFHRLLALLGKRSGIVIDLVGAPSAPTQG